MKIYICHDDRLEDRRLKLLYDLTKVDGDFDIEWVVDYRTSEIEADFEERVRNGGIVNNVTIREYSLYLKHYHCYERILEHGVGLILEDDVVLPSNLEAVIAKCGEADYDFISLSDRVQRGNVGGYVYDIGKFKLEPLRVNTFTHAQILNAKAAGKMLGMKYPCSRPIDIHIFDNRGRLGMRMACLTPGFDQDKNTESSLRKNKRMITVQ